MAHFCKLDENNIVVEVIVIDNNELLDENNKEQESLGINFITNTLGLTGTWIQTSYNTFGNQHETGGIPLRGNFAGIGYSYDSENNVFIPIKPSIIGKEYILNTTNWLWEEKK
tara:strand:+ start:120 stop:458 length:339 start_codon:yes stop_codon:yes gene_type:complete